MTVKMMKVVAAVSVAVCFGTASAQQTISVNLGQQGALGVSQAGGDTVKVQGRGVGIDEVSALKDAYRDAIERAVGLYVDAEQVAKNNELVKDQILTHSNAYIMDCQKLSSERIEGGLVQLRILATVKKRALTKRITDVIPAQVVSLGQEMQNLHANVATNDKRNKDAAAILKAALEGVDPIRQLVVPTICPETRQLVEGKQAGHWFDEMKYHNNGIPAGKIGFSYLFKLQVNRDKYFKEFVPHLKKVLDQISLSPPKTFRISGLVENENDSRLYYMKDYLKGGEKRNTRGDVEDGCFGFYNPLRAMTGTVDGFMWNLMGAPQAFFRNDFNAISLRINGHSLDRLDEITQSIFTLVIEMNDDNSFGKAIQYKLDKKTTHVLDAWFKTCGCSYDRSGSDSMNFNIVFLDKENNEIGVFPWKIPRRVLMNVGSTHFYPDDRSDSKYAALRRKWGLTDYQPMGAFYSSPFIGCAGDTFIQWRDFVLSTDDLARIASVRIEPID